MLLLLFSLAGACGGTAADDRLTAADDGAGSTSSVAPAPASSPGTVVVATGDEPETGSAEQTSTSQPATSTSEAGTTTSEAGTTSTESTQATGAADENDGTWGSAETVRLRFESQVDDVPVAEFEAAAMAILTDPRGWGLAGFTFVADPEAPFRVVLAEGPEVDALCLPLVTYSKVSCQNGPVVALNADRWRGAVDHWVLDVEVYRGYLVNHEVGHLLGQRHPKPRCPVAGQPAGVMEQQTAGLEGCIGNPWPREWEIEYAGQRPVVYAPLPDWGPDPVPENREGQ